MIINRYPDVPVEYLEDRDLRALIDTRGLGLGRPSLAEETFQPGQYIPPHYHADLEEVYHVKAGQGRMQIGGEGGDSGRWRHHPHPCQHHAFVA